MLISIQRLYKFLNICPKLEEFREYKNWRLQLFIFATEWCYRKYCTLWRWHSFLGQQLHILICWRRRKFAQQRKNYFGRLICCPSNSPHCKCCTLRPGLQLFEIKNLKCQYFKNSITSPLTLLLTCPPVRPHARSLDRLINNSSFIFN